MAVREPGARAPKDFRDKLPFRLAVVAAFVVAIFLVSRGCQDAGIETTQEEAVAIATEAVDFTPDPETVQVRLVRQGFTPRWFVSLSQSGEDGQLVNTTVVEVDADTGEVLSIRPQ